MADGNGDQTRPAPSDGTADAESRQPESAGLDGRERGSAAVDSPRAHDPTDGGEADGDGDPATPMPTWDDEYLDRVADRLVYSYDLEKDRLVEGESFDLYGRMDIENRKQFLHPAITYGHHEVTQHLFVRRVPTVSPADLEALAALGDRLGDEWVDPDERHFATEFVFGVVAPTVADPVEQLVRGFESRTLLHYGYHGHYAVRLFVVAPEEREAVSSPDVDVAAAFRLWDGDDERGASRDGVIARLAAALGIDRDG